MSNSSELAIETSNSKESESSPQHLSHNEHDMARIFEDSEPFLSTTNENGDLSTYFLQTDVTAAAEEETPMSLEEQQPDDGALKESEKIAHLLDYYVDRLNLESKAPDPSGCDMTTSTAATAPMTHFQTPAFRDRSNLSTKALFQTTGKRSVASKERDLVDSSMLDSILEQKSENLDRNISLEMDASLQQLLADSVDASSTPARKTWQVSEDEWKRLEHVTKMAQFALHEAVKEREAARAWATTVRDSVRKWAGNQMAASDDNAMKRMRLDMEAAASQEKKKLETVIQRQADKIQLLEEQLAKVSESKTTTPREATTGLFTPRRSPTMTRVSMSPVVAASTAQVEGGGESPISCSDPSFTTTHEALSANVPSPVSMAITPRTQRARTSLPDGGKLLVYRSGTEKETRPDGTCIIRFPNGDVKCTKANQEIVAYYHAKEKTTHIRHRNGVEIFEYPNGQVEHHFPGGQKDIRFPDGTKRRMFPDGTTETVFPEGTRVKEANGKKEITG